MERFGFNPKLYISLSKPWWLKSLNDCYTEDNLQLMRAYLLCQYAVDCIALLDEDCYRKYQQLQIEHGVMSEPREDEYYAVKDVNLTLSNFVDQMYVDKYCSDKMRQNIKDVIERVIAEYWEMLKDETWLSAETRNMAIQKLDALRVYAVYPNPDEREDWSGYHFTSRSDGGNYLMAVKEINRCALELKRKKSQTQPDPTIW